VLVPNALLLLIGLCGGVGVHLCLISIRSWSARADATDLPLATGHGDVDEAAGVSEPLLGAALGGLLLLLGLNLLPVCQPRSCSLVQSSGFNSMYRSRMGGHVGVSRM
jgi:hypothetical protein